MRVSPESQAPSSSQDYIAVTKSPSCEIRIRLKHWRGETKIDIREFTATIPMVFMSTASGITLKLDRLPELIAALQALTERRAQ